MMSPNKSNPCHSHDSIEESTRIAIFLTLKKFSLQEDEKEYSFPSSFCKNEKSFIRNLIQGMGIKSKTEVKDHSCVLTIFKDEESTIMEKDPLLEISIESQKLVKEFLKQFPLTEREKQEISPFSDREKNPYCPFEARNFSRTVSKLKSSRSIIPPKPIEREATSEVVEFRENLPIYKSKSVILSSIQNHQVTLLTGPPGCGKTTQVPQYLLELASDIKSPVRIICSQPRRFAVLSTSERVSHERGESLGTTVGYQIRLESMTSPKTALYFCTYSILLRSLMGEVEPFLQSLTHIIIDEVHERNVQSDFLLTIIREHLNKCPHVKLILMSASQDVNFLTNYFSGIHHVYVPHSGFTVEELYLEDILGRLNYSTPEMKHFLELRNQGGCEEICDNCEEKEVFTSSDVKVNKVDESLSLAFTEDSREYFKTVYWLILDSKMSINYQHSSSGITLLMIAAVHGYLDYLENILLNGGDVSLRSNNNWTALEFAKNREQSRVKAVLSAMKEAAFSLNSSEKDDKVLAYENCRSTEVDLNMVHEIIKHICSLPEAKDEHTDKAILVFLPGYEEISRLWSILSINVNYCVFMLHSRIMECRDTVFKEVAPGKRKIILSSSIAEASITFNDIAYVIDSGRREIISNDVSFDVKDIWISKKSAIWRGEQAGRNWGGYIYRIYTRHRYESFIEDHAPEMRQCSLIEICLQCKLLAPPNTSIVEFLAKCLDPPHTSATRTAIRTLRELEALNSSNEDITELGNHLLDFPVDPHLGKMLLWAVTLKCLDPVLTIVCCLSCPEPFIMNTAHKESVLHKKLEFAAGTYSDHMVRLRVFQAWQKATDDGMEDEFCEKHFVSSSIMNAITGLRSQLLGHLRATGFVRPRGWGDIKSLNQYSDNWALVKAALLAGYYPNLARYDGYDRLKTAKEKKVNLHPYSALSQHASPKALELSEVTRSAMNSLSNATDWLMFDHIASLSFGSHPLLVSVTPVSPISVFLFTGPNRLPIDINNGTSFLEDLSDSDEPFEEATFLKLDEWTTFQSSTMNLASSLRQKLSALFLRRLHHPKKTFAQADDFIVKVVAEALAIEDSNLGLKQPSGIGQKPRSIEAFRQGCFETETNEESVMIEDTPTNTGGPLLSRSANPLILQSFKFFIIKATCAQALEISLYNGVWQFGNQTEKKLLKAVKQDFNPVIIFSIHGSGHFQGFAKFVGNPSLQHIPELVSQSSGSGSGTQYLIRWIRFSPLPFSATRHLINPYINRPVQFSRDGQELEPGVGDALCRLWDTPSPHQSCRKERGEESFLNGPPVSPPPPTNASNPSNGFNKKNNYFRY